MKYEIVYDPKFKCGDCVIRNDEPDTKFIINRIVYGTKKDCYYYLYDMYGESCFAINSGKEHYYSKADKQFIIDNAEYFI
jgi:hypothetical protein